MIKIKGIAFKTCIIVSFIFVFMLFSSKTALAAECGGIVQCECGDDLIESQTMWYDLIDCPIIGLSVEASDITLDCNDHIISGANDAYWGVLIEGAKNNTTITNCNIQNWEKGIYSYTSSYGNFLNNNVVSGHTGIHLYAGDYNLVQNNTVSGASSKGVVATHGNISNEIRDNNFSNNAGGAYFGGYGLNVIDNKFNNNDGNAVYSVWLTNSLFEGNQFNNNTRGVYLSTTNNNDFTNNEFIDNSIHGLGLQFTNNDNTFWNNTFINPIKNVSFGSYSGINNFYSTTTAEGNFWNDFESNPGYPNYYEVYAGNETYPAQYDMFPSMPIPNTDCGGTVQCECGDTLVENHTMDYDLTCNTAPGEVAITINNDAINLDCDGYSISGIGDGIGIYNQSNNSSINNCNVSNFFWGVNNSITSQVTESLESYPLLTKNESEKPVLFKEYFSINKLKRFAITNNSTSNTYINNNIFNNIMEGLVLSGDNHIVENNTFYGNGNVGLYIKASNSQFLNNTSTDNSWVGILNDGNNNIYRANNINSNQIGIYGLGNYSNYTTNNIYSNDIGIKNLGDNNDFTLNNFYNNSEFGLEFVDTSVIDIAEDNIVWDNIFTNNDINAADEGINNLFDNLNLGNFWDDYEFNSGFSSGQYIIPTNGIDYFPISYTVDVDGDGYFFNANQSLENEDCNDDDPNVNPGMSEIIFNGIDDNCNGRIDEHSKPRIIFMRETPIEDDRF